MYQKPVRITGTLIYTSLWKCGLSIIWNQGTAFVFDLVGGDLDEKILESSDMSRDQEPSSVRTASSSFMNEKQIHSRGIAQWLPATNPLLSSFLLTNNEQPQRRSARDPCQQRI